MNHPNRVHARLWPKRSPRTPPPEKKMDGQIWISSQYCAMNMLASAQIFVVVFECLWMWLRCLSVCLYLFCHIWSGKRVGVFGMCFNLCVYILMRLYINARRVCVCMCLTRCFVSWCWRPWPPLCLGEKQLIDVLKKNII